MKNTESGRSMVEMLGVLAIIGVLSVGGIAGYTMAMKNYKANEIINAASMLAIHTQTKQPPVSSLSYNTALHILNLTNRAPFKIDVTVPRDKKVRGKYNVHRVSKKYYSIGIIESLSPYGNPIKIYNAERCICDMLRTEGEFDLGLQNIVLDYYFSSKNKNIDKLLEYAKVFNIYDKVNTIAEVMMRW